MAKEFSLDEVVFQPDKDFSLTYRKLLAVIKEFNEGNTKPSKSDIIQKMFGANMVSQKWMRKKITDMLKILDRKGYLFVSPILDSEGKYMGNMYTAKDKPNSEV